MEVRFDVLMGAEFLKTDLAELWQAPSTGLRIVLQLRDLEFGIRTSLSFLRENRGEDELMR